MADSGHPPAELHERLLICRTIKLNAGAHGGHRRCCHAQMQKNAQNKPQMARLILCVHTTLQVYCNLFLTFCFFFQNQVSRTAALSDSLVRIPSLPNKVNPFFKPFSKTRHRRVDTHGFHHRPLYSDTISHRILPSPINFPYSSSLFHADRDGLRRIDWA